MFSYGVDTRGDKHIRTNRERVPYVSSKKPMLNSPQEFYSRRFLRLEVPCITPFIPWTCLNGFDISSQKREGNSLRRMLWLLYPQDAWMPSNSKIWGLW